MLSTIPRSVFSPLGGSEEGVVDLRRVEGGNAGHGPPLSLLRDLVAEPEAQFVRDCFHGVPLTVILVRERRHIRPVALEGSRRLHLQ